MRPFLMIRHMMVSSFFGDKSRWPLWLHAFHLKWLFRHHRKRGFDLCHPETFTEKILWYMLFYRHEELPGIVDKISFKAFVEKKLGPGHTIPLLGAYDSMEDLERAWDSLPEDVVIKSTCSGYDGNMMVIHQRSQMPFSSVRKTMANAFVTAKTLVNSDRWAYLGITPRVLAEEYRSNGAGMLYDYKVFCFHGEPRYFYVRVGDTYTFYDMDWTRQEVTYRYHAMGSCEKPARFDEMVRLSRVLSADFPFVRVDFFDDGSQLYVGEMTFYSGGPESFYTPDSFDRVLGSCWHLERIPKENIVPCRWTRRLV